MRALRCYLSSEKQVTCEKIPYLCRTLMLIKAPMTLMTVKEIRQCVEVNIEETEWNLQEVTSPVPNKNHVYHVYR